MVWFTSDLHFGHTGILNYCDRPFTDLQEMHTKLIRNWNFCVAPNDTIYVLGDLSLCPFREFEPIAAQLNGNKILVQGNHDHYSNSQYERLGFKVFQELKIKLAGANCRLSHFPYALPWYKQPFAFKSELRFMDRRPPKILGEILLHGHTHTSYKSAANRIHVGCDAWDYRPVSMREIESLINRIRKPND